VDREGFYNLTKSELLEIQEDFDATFSSDSECRAIIKEYAESDTPYLMDPHTCNLF